MESAHIVALDGPTYMIYRAWPRQKKKHTITGLYKPTELPNPLTQNLPTRTPIVPALPNQVIIPPKRQSSQEGAVGKSKLAFVNSTRPAQNLEPEMRKLVRSHVMKGTTTRNKRHQEHGSQKKALVRRSKRTQARSNCQLDVPNVSLKSPFGGGILHYLDSIAVDLQPRMRSLMLRHVTDVASALYPMEFLFTFNPFRRIWFDYHMTDQMMFHAGLYMSSTYLGILDGTAESEEAAVQMVQAVRMISERLNGEVEVDEKLISAVSCLAMGEALLGHSDKWHMHMKGVQQMLEIKGGFDTLSIGLQMKLFRCDTIGAVAFLQPPKLKIPNHPLRFFDALTSVLPPELLNPSTFDPFIYLLTTNAIPAALIATLSDLFLFSRAIAYALTHRSITFDPMAFIAASSGIQRSLLVTSTETNLINLAQNLDRSHNSLAFLLPSTTLSSPSSLSASLRLAALLYMKLLLREFPLAPTISTNLLHALRAKLPSLPRTAPRHTTQLLLWIALVGAVAASERAFPGGPALASVSALPSPTDTVPLLASPDTPSSLAPAVAPVGKTDARSQTHRAFFVAHLVRVAGALGVRSWADVEAVLRDAGLPWVESVHGYGGRRVWGEVEVVRDVLVEN